MKAVIYARKSNEQNVSDDAKSVTRQVELARAFAKTKGWKVTEEYADDGISGVMATKLVSRAKMLAAAAAETFGVLVVRDLDRLSRNDEELPGLIYTLRDAGVEVWCYSDGQRVDTQTAMHRGMLNMKGTFAAAEREAAQQRTREAMRAKAKAGHVAGGKVYGYDNAADGSHRKRVINVAEAGIVRRIFTLSADGWGLLRIAKTLNAEGVKSPTGRGWASTGIREMLRRDLYRGQMVYGKTRWQYRKGSKRKIDVPAKEWITVDTPHLRIVAEGLWKRVQERQEQTLKTYSGRRTNGQLQGRREGGPLVSQYLLSGFLRCGACGGNLIVTARSGRGGIKRYWICTTAHHRGKDICSNVQGIPYEPLTRSVVERFKTNFFNPVALGRLLMHELDQQAVAPEAAKADAETMRRDIAKLDRETARLVTAVAEGTGDVAPLAEGIRSRERQKADLQAKLEHLDGLQQAAASFNVVEWIEETAALLADTRDLLEGDPGAGRQLLRRCLPGPLKVTPDGKGGWDYEGEGLFVEGDVRDLTFGLISRGFKGNIKVDPLEVVPPG